MTRRYATPPGGLPGPTALTTDTAVFTEAYAVIPRGALRDIVASRLPHWRASRAWVLARPLSGFAETFAETIVEIAPGGGCDTPEAEPEAESALFVLDGRLALTLDGAGHDLAPGGFAYLAPGADWRVETPDGACLVWIRRRHLRVAGLGPPDSFVTAETAHEPEPMPGFGDAWTTTRFMDPEDLRHDMHVTVVGFAPGGAIPFAETHVMEHGLYVLEGKAVYRLNRDWVEGEAGDFMWLRAFCPQACYAGGPGPFRYLLYKDVNR
ncbi:MAG: bifunctional allantoicase/(S)-ureidoglycine aminohydrolase, partial [Paracoccaceae bacterium]